MAVNPFKPTAGKVPPVLVGRQSVIDDLEEGLDNGAGAPGRLMLISGQRGYGKTVMLSEARRIATERGWLVVGETASAGMCERLVDALSPRRALVTGASVSPAVAVAGVASLSLGGVSLSAPAHVAVTLRQVIAERLKKLPKGKGILFAIDEAQAASMADMVTLATTLQLCIADEDQRDVPDVDKHGIAFVFAALPSLIDDVLHEKVLTFLRRAQQRHLGGVPTPDVRDAYTEVVRGAGKEISDDVAFAAARAAEGHPYLVQLVGYYMWRAADRRRSAVIERRDVDAGAKDALMAFYEAVCAPLYYGLRSPQRLFVEAMAVDGGRPSRLSDIAERCERTSAWASKYRASLIRERVIEAAGYGLVRFATPHLGDYVQNEILWHE